MATTTTPTPPITVGRQRAIPREREGFDMPKLARRIWPPMMLMGLMAVVVGIIAGIAQANTSDVVDVARLEAWTPGVLFLGIGFLLAGVTFLLATILGELRDGGTRVQRNLGASVLILKRPVTGYLFPAAMMMGLMVLMVAAALGFYQATEVDSDPALAADLAAWLGPVRFGGLALIFSGIALALLTIGKALRFQSDRLGQIAGWSKGS